MDGRHLPCDVELATFFIEFNWLVIIVGCIKAVFFLHFKLTHYHLTIVVPLTLWFDCLFASLFSVFPHSNRESGCFVCLLFTCSLLTMQLKIIWSLVFSTLCVIIIYCFKKKQNDNFLKNEIDPEGKHAFLQKWKPHLTKTVTVGYGANKYYDCIILHLCRSINCVISNNNQLNFHFKTVWQCCYRGSMRLAVDVIFFFWKKKCHFWSLEIGK